MVKADSGFDGISAEELPDVQFDYSCKSSDSPVNPEVVVDIRQDIGLLQGEGETIFGFEGGVEGETEEVWVRIPVTEVEEWLNKDGPSDITRTAKVKFPLTWGDVDIINFIDGFNSHNPLSNQPQPYDQCRIFFYDNDIDAYQISHYGYVGGVGSANEEGVGKLWVYDPADLMRGITLSETWADPDYGTLLDFALNGVDERGEDVGILRRSVFDTMHFSILGFNDASSIEQNRTEPYERSGAYQLVDGTVFAAIDPLGVTDDATQTIFNTAARDQKRFQANKHNMVDFMDWVATLLDGRWWFEPRPDGPVLIIDATAHKPGNRAGKYDRRYFIDQQALQKWEDIRQLAIREDLADALGLEGFEIGDLPSPVSNAMQRYLDGEVSNETDIRNLIDPSGIDDNFLPPHKYQVFTDITTLNNSALVDIKPFNTLILNGEATAIRERYSTPGGIGIRSLTDDEDFRTEAEAVQNIQSFDEAAAPGSYTEQYPHVKVTYQPLLDRAGGYEYASSVVESDKIYLFQAEQEARNRFRRHLSESTEGEVEILGEPHILPHDYFVTLPACEGTYDIDVQPITWKVNAVKHTRSSDGHYTTDLRVSLAVHDRFIEVEGEYKTA